MTTKEKIIEEALTLFSEKGFSGVSVKEIADAVGIKDSSLYKHFKSKKEIYDNIITGMCTKMNDMSHKINMPSDITDENIEKLVMLTVDELIDITQKSFLFYCRDSYASRFRRMLLKEQSTDKIESDLYRKIFIVESIKYQSELFAALMKHNIMKQTDPEIAAMIFYAPVFLLINRYDNCENETDEALRKIAGHVREFYRIYF